MENKRSATAEAISKNIPHGVAGRREWPGTRTRIEVAIARQGQGIEGVQTAAQYSGVMAPTKERIQRKPDNASYAASST